MTFFDSIQSVWKNSSRPFLISSSDVISYGKLHEDLSSSRIELIKAFPTRQLFVVESTNSYSTYLKFLSLIAEGHIVFLSPAYQFNDVDYRKMIENEMQSTFHYVPIDKNIWDNTSGTSSSHHPLIKKQLSQNKPAFIVRTSGTSGKKFKFILHDPALFFKKHEAIETHYEKTLAFFPADSIAGIETLIEVIVNESTLFIEAGKITPSEVARLIDHHGLDYLHVTPSFLNLMLITGAFSKCLDSLKKIAFGSEPVSMNTIMEIKLKLPKVSFKHIYGMSEIGLLETFTNQNNPSLFTFNEKFNSTRMINDELEVQSSTQSLGYINYDNHEGPWFKTGDVISISDDSAMKIVGRMDDLINMAGKKFYPSDVEDLLIKMPGVLDVVVLSEKNEIIGNVIIARFFIDSSIDEFTFRANLKNHCEEFIPPHMYPHKIILLKEPPITSRFKKSRTL